MHDTFTAIVLKQQDYKDASAIITVLSKEYGKLSLVASGIRKPNSKNAGRLLPYTIGTFMIDYKEDKTMFRLQNVSTVSLFRHIHEDITLSTCASLLAEVSNKMVLNGIESEFYDEMYDFLENAFHLLEEGKDPLTITALFLVDAMELFGITPDVDECVHCGSESVSAISIQDGGFLCANCANSLHINLTNPLDLKRFRLLVKGGLDHIDVIESITKAAIEDISILVEMIQTHSGIKIQSFGLFKRLFDLE